jgi:outer membrane receptor protein involved in Fe transport
MAIATAGAQAPVAATASIDGVVRDSGGNFVLSDVAVRIEGTTIGMLSQSDGRFTFTNLAPGEYTLVAKRIGYADVRRTVQVNAGQPVEMTIQLTPSATVIEPTIVSAERERQMRSEASATINVIDGAELRRSGAAHPNEVMNRLPGVHLIELSGEGHMTAIRQPITTKPVYLYLEDGVPTRATGFFNHNALYEVNLPQAGGIEVLKGPGTALYGSDAIGGVINALTRDPPESPSFEATLEGGAFGWGRALFTGGTTSGDNGVRADLNLTRTDGWRDGSAYNREVGTVRWDHTPVGGWHAKTILTASRIHQSDAYTLDQTQFDSRSSINRSPISFRRVQAIRASSAIEREKGKSLWSFTPYARDNLLDLMPYWQLTYDPQLWDTRNTSLGMLAKYRRDFEPLKARIITGVDFDWSPGSFNAKQVVTSRSGINNSIWSGYTIGETQYDYDVTYRAASPYAQLEATILPGMRVDLGMRYDVSGYSYNNNLSVDESPLSKHRRPADTDVSYTHLSPKLGVTYELGKGNSVFASYRHGFRAPSQGQLFQQNTAANTVDLEPVKVDSYEAGIRGQLLQRFLYELSVYDMTISDDILTFITPSNSREAVNAGKSRYKGIEIGTGIALAPMLRLDLSYSRTSQRYVDYVPQAAQPATASAPAKAAIDYSGNLVEQAPRSLANAFLTWSPSVLKGGRVAFEYSHTGSYPGDAANTAFYSGFDLFNAQGSVQVHPSAELYARVTNLLNRQYAALASYDAFQSWQYNPGSPRSIYAGIRYRWDR